MSNVIKNRFGKKVVGRSISGKGYMIDTTSINRIKDKVVEDGFFPSTTTEILAHSCYCSSTEYTFEVPRHVMRAIVLGVAQYTFFDSSVKSRVNDIAKVDFKFNGIKYNLIKVI